MKADLQRVASETVSNLAAMEGIDGVIVITVRNSNDSMGCSMSAKDVSVDSLIAAVVQLLGQMRGKALDQVNENSNSRVTFDN